MTKILVVINNDGTHSVYTDSTEHLRVAVVSKPRLAALAGAASDNAAYAEAAHGPTRFIVPTYEGNLTGKRDELVQAQAPVQDTEYEVVVTLKVRASDSEAAHALALDKLEVGDYDRDAVSVTPAAEPASTASAGLAQARASHGCR